MKKITLFVVGGLLSSTLIILGCSNFQKRDPAQAQVKPKHYVMTLHGIRGNEVSFGDFHALIKTHLEKIDPGYEVVPVNMTYTIAQTDYTPEKAGNEVKVKLGKIVPELEPNDQISVVGYSMGGQVGLAWYFESLKDPNYRKYAEHLKHFIGLGSAAWGAKEAGLVTSDVKVLRDTIKFITLEIRNILRNNSKKYLGETLTSGLEWVQGKTDAQVDAALDKLQTIDQLQAFYDKYIRTNSMVKISFNELKGLSLGGIGATNLRLGLLSSPTNQVKWTTIAPLVQCFETNQGARTEGCDDFQNPVFKYINESINKPYTFGFKRRETDNAVITPSGNTQFISVVETDSNYTDGAVTPIAKSKYAINPAQHRLYFTEASHATVVTATQYDKAVEKLSKLGDSWTRLAGDVVLVYNSQCSDIEKCASHPTYKYIVNELADCTRNNSTCSSSDRTLSTLLKPEAVATAQNKLASEVHGFTVELNLRLPKGYNISKFDDKNILNYIQFETEKVGENKYLKSSLNTENYIAVAREKEIASVLIKKMTQYADQEQLKVNLTGLFIPKNESQYNFKSLENGTPISFKVALPGMKSRFINTIVRPYHSTYVDLKMGAQ